MLEEDVAVPAEPRPRRPPEIWPGLLALLVLVLAGLGAWFVLLRDDAGEGAVYTVPALIGLQEDEAVARVEDRGLAPSVTRRASPEEPGTVVAQDPRAGAEVAADHPVRVSVSKGSEAPPAADDADGDTGTFEALPPPPTKTGAAAGGRVVLPRMVGLKGASVVAALRAEGLEAQVKSVAAEQAAGVVVAAAPGEGKRVAAGSTVVLRVSKGPAAAPVPDAVGQKAADAVELLRAAGFEVRLVDVPGDEPAGTVVAQAPKAGAQAKAGSEVRLNVSAGAAPAPPPSSRTAMPEVVGQTEASARAALRDAGLEASVERVPSLEPKGTVVAQAQPAGQAMDRGDQVQINVSNGEKPGTTQGSTIMPDVVGLPLDEARSELRAAGLLASVKRVPSVEQEDTVVAQAKKPGVRLPRGSRVQINVANGELPQG